MNDDLQLHYGEYWADAMGLTDEEIIEQIKQIKRDIRRLKVKWFFFRRPSYQIFLYNMYASLGYFQWMLKARKAVNREHESH